MLKAEQSEPITEPLWNGAGQQKLLRRNKCVFIASQLHTEVNSLATVDKLNTKKSKINSKSKYQSSTVLRARNILLNKPVSTDI